MQIAVDTGRMVRQHGAGLGDLDGCTVEEIGDPAYAAFLAALPDHGGGVTISADHQTITPNPEPPNAALRQARVEQLTADRALLAASDDPVHQALARLLGIS